MNIEKQLAHALGYEWITGGECVCVRPIERDADGIAQVTCQPDESEFVTMRAGYDKLTGVASSLLAENARLREALERVIGAYSGATREPILAWEDKAIEHARVALAEGGAK